MNIDQFLSMQDGEIMTAAQAEKLNKELATISVNDIAVVDRPKIADYLAIALNLNSVDESLVDSLDSLLQCIQEESV